MGVSLRVRVHDRNLRGMEEGMREGVQNIGLAIEGVAKQLAPVRTGRLVRSITAGVGQSRGSGGRFSGGLSVTVGSDVEYARYVEEGTSRMGAQPYLAPAIKAVMPRAQHIIAAAIAKHVGP